MDDLIVEFIAETNESIGALDSEIVRLEQNPNDIELLNSIFRLMHTIKGTCGFLGLERLQKVAHSGENILDKMRNHELEVTSDGVSLILECIDVIKGLLEALEQTGAEPAGDDSEIILRLDAFAENGSGGGVVVKPEISEEETMHAMAEVAIEEDEHGFTPVPAALTGAASSGDFNEDDFVPVPAGMTGHGNAPQEPKQAEQEVVKEQVKKVAIAAGVEASRKAAEKEKVGGGKVSVTSANANAAIRVNVDTLENLMQLVSELVLTRNQMMQLIRTNPDLGSDFTSPFHRLSLITTDLQEGVMKTRMQPIGTAWSKLPRIIRDLSMELGKKIDLKMTGEETELDRQMLELIKDPLTHMVRNSADHGIESSAERLAAGKPETGTVHLSAYHEGGHIIVQIKDDGKGIDPEVIGRKAIEKGLATQSQIDQMDNRQIYQFIFAAGFSTAAVVTSVSGRGVGMDVVRTNVEKMGGSIDLNSEKGFGSTFQVKIPLTLAIMPVLLMESAGQRFAIPQINIIELVRVDNNRKDSYKIERVNNSEVLRLRGRLLPLINLSQALGIEEIEARLDKNGRTAAKYIAVCEQGAMNYGLIVDRIFDTEEIVVKPVSSALKAITLYSGSTILGDGSVVMILDPNGLAKSLNLKTTQQQADAKDEQASDEDKQVPFLLFKAGDGAPKAVPLEIVSRLEEVAIGDIEKAGAVDVVQYRGDLMRLVKINDSYAYKEGLESNSVIVFSEGEKTLGLVVEKIVDIVQEAVTVDLHPNNSICMGSMVINGKTTDIIDVAYLFKTMFDDWGSYEPAELGKLGKGRILIVEDSLFFRKMIVPTLASRGFEVHTAINGLDAVNILQKDPNFDLIVTDIDMPEMDGLEFAEACKGDEVLCDVPIIALTATTQTGARAKAVEIGLFDFISKSDREGLFNAVDRAFAAKIVKEGV
jgi:two-component system chemotaxis sensor kinase CheA